MNIRFDSILTRDLAHATSREWLESNGLGGWSSSTISIVWGWLIGPFITALCRVHGDEARQRGRDIIEGFAENLQEAGLGSVSEIFDAEPPFAPRGCVAELLRAGVEDVLQEDSE